MALNADWKKVRSFFTLAQDNERFGEVATNMLKLSEELEVILPPEYFVPNTSLLELVLVLSASEEQIRIGWEHDNVFVVYNEALEFRRTVSKDRILQTIQALHDLLRS